jgi:hypothetical protein
MRDMPMRSTPTRSTLAECTPVGYLLVKEAHP